MDDAKPQKQQLKLTVVRIFVVLFLKTIDELSLL